MAPLFAWAMILAVSIPMVAARSPTGYLGCYREGMGGRALSEKMFTSGSMTNQACESFCTGFRYHGTEYGHQCFCGSKLQYGAYQVPDSACGTACPGNDTQVCGGGDLLSVYKSNFTSENPKFNYTYVGCAAEPDVGRALERVVSAKLMTTNKCLVMCSYGDFEWAGLEYGSECWCGHALANVNFTGTCDVPCTGNTSDVCGGPKSLNLYNKTTQRTS